MCERVCFDGERLFYQYHVLYNIHDLICMECIIEYQGWYNIDYVTSKKYYFSSGFSLFLIHFTKHTIAELN